MNKGSFWRLLLISCLSMLMVACKPSAEFSVSPTPVIAGAAATFDASETTIYNTHKGNAAVSYSWDFGDGVTGSGKVVQHTYAAAGTYQVKLSVKDKAGQTGTVSHAVVVQAATATAPIRVVVQLAGGVPLPGALVQVGSATGVSNDQGVAALANVPTGPDQVVTVKKTGYVTQSLRTTLAAGATPQQLLVLLLPLKDTLSIADIAAAQTIQSNYLGASVTLPANALVNATTGAPATGPATLQLTPWDIAGIDLEAMPGNGRALDGAGNVVDLISAGMMTVDFFDTAGNKLQIAAGQSATIQMNLPVGTTGIGGNPVAEGTSIPLWHFDEVRGLWIGEGSGVVVATQTGLAVKGTVSHFSTWNWDYVTATPAVGDSSGGGSVPPDATTLTLSCINPDGVLSACSVRAKITYPDGSIRSWSYNLSAAVTTIRNIPGSPSMEWTATTVDGLSGTATSGTTGNVVIQLTPPNVSNFVRCLAPGNIDTPCKVTRTAPLADGSIDTMTSYIPADGAVLRARLETSGPLTWTASTGFAASGNSTWTKYSGTASSGISGTVSIGLTAETVTTGKTVLVSCLPDALDINNNPVPLASCQIELKVYGSEGELVDSFVVPSGLGAPVAVQLPALDNAVLVVYGYGTSIDPTPFPGSYEGGSEFELSDLANNQNIAIQIRAQIIDIN